jgi:predicted nucleotidyltransferase
MEPQVHRLLRAQARRDGLSLNDYCVRKLSAPMGTLTLRHGLAACVHRAAGIFGEHFIGAVAFGSWVRGDAADGSDLDLLIVLEPGVRIGRATYRAWDEESSTAEGRPVDVHFIHLPQGETTAGVWAEAALEGVTLYDPGLRLSRRLAATRRDIAAGRIVRRVSHGQPYWTHGDAA